MRTQKCLPNGHYFKYNRYPMGIDKCCCAGSGARTHILHILSVTHNPMFCYAGIYLFITLSKKFLGMLPFIFINSSSDNTPSFTCHMAFTNAIYSPPYLAVNSLNEILKFDESL